METQDALHQVRREEASRGEGREWKGGREKTKRVVACEDDGGYYKQEPAAYWRTTGWGSVGEEEEKNDGGGRREWGVEEVEDGEEMECGQSCLVLPLPYVLAPYSESKVCKSKRGIRT